MTTTPPPRRRTATVNLPFLTAEFRAPEIRLPSIAIPDRGDLTDAVSALRARLPSPGQAAYYAGLGVLGVLELVEWPVALAIGVGTVIAQYGSQQGSDSRGGRSQRPGREESPRLDREESPRLDHEESPRLDPVEPQRRGA